VLAYGFIENRLFPTKTDRNSVFLGRDPHISDQLYIIDMYMSLSDFKKNQICSQNLYVLTYDFIENHQFITKTYRNSVFLGCEAHILD
jgi:hypothetical protein